MAGQIEEFSGAARRTFADGAALRFAESGRSRALVKSSTVTERGDSRQKKVSFCGVLCVKVLQVFVGQLVNIAGSLGCAYNKP